MDAHAPFEEVNKNKLKFKTKLWITPVLQKSISIKNTLLKKFITAKDKEYKDYRNMLSTILKQNKTTTIIILKPTGTASKTLGKT